MIPSDFPEANLDMRPPEGLDESQVGTIRAFHGVFDYGNLDGAHFYVSCWKPTPAELEELNRGNGIYITWLGGLPPHAVNSDFPYIREGE